MLHSNLTRLGALALFLSLGGCEADAAPLEADVVVVSAGQDAPVAAGTRCLLRMQPAWRQGVNCQVHLACGEEDLFGGRRVGGYSVCNTEAHAFLDATDDEAIRDGDPALVIDLRAGTLDWRGARPGQVLAMRVQGPTRPTERFDTAQQ